MAKEDRTIAIAYDFDGTLARGNIQENSFIPKLKMTKEEFWGEVNKVSKKDKMDPILAYMYLIVEKAREKKVKITEDSFKSHGKKVEYFEGTETWFKRINSYAKTKNIKLNHYIISSGTKEMIEQTSIAEHFKQIYASSFKYDHNGVPVWPAQAINYTTKVQYLFRINKGFEDVWENKKINEYMPEKERAVPFENIIYIGDGLTDVPAMLMLNYKGGSSIGVYDNLGKEAKENKKKAKELLEHGRFAYAAPASYEDGSTLDKIVKGIISNIDLRQACKAMLE